MGLLLWDLLWVIGWILWYWSTTHFRATQKGEVLQFIAWFGFTWRNFLHFYDLLFDTQNGWTNDQSIFVDDSLGTRPSIKLSPEHKGTLIRIKTRDPQTKTGRSWSPNGTVWSLAVRGSLIKTKMSLCDYFYKCKSYVTMNHPRKTAFIIRSKKRH